MQAPSPNSGASEDTHFSKRLSRKGMAGGLPWRRAISAFMRWERCLSLFPRASCCACSTEPLEMSPALHAACIGGTASRTQGPGIACKIGNGARILTAEEYAVAQFSLALALGLRELLQLSPTICLTTRT